MKPFPAKRRRFVWVSMPTTGCTRRSSNGMAGAAKLAVPCVGPRSIISSTGASRAMIPRTI